MSLLSRPKCDVIAPECSSNNWGGLKGTVSRYCACTELWFSDGMSPNSKDARRVRELRWKICLHRAWPSSILYWKFSDLQINDILFPLSFDLSEIGIFLALLSLLLAGGPRKGKRFNASLRLISPTSFHTSSDNRERNTQKWNSNNKHYVRMKPSRHGCDRGDLVELNSVKHSLQRLLVNF